MIGQALRIAALGLALVFASPAVMARAEANPVEQNLVASLQASGYHIVEIGYTWLGRLRIVAENDTLHRELVVNPGTGEILRDYAILLAEMPQAPGVIVTSANGGHGSTDKAGTVTMSGAVDGSGDPEPVLGQAKDIDPGTDSTDSTSAVILPGSGDVPSSLLLDPIVTQ